MHFACQRQPKRQKQSGSPMCRRKEAVPGEPAGISEKLQFRPPDQYEIANSTLR